MWLDVLMLAEWRSVEEVGVYSASYKVVDIFQARVAAFTKQGAGADV